MKRIFEIQPWNIVSHNFSVEDKRLQESMTSLGNEHMGLRGFFEEDYSADTHIGTYIGGVWYPDKTRVGWWKNGYPNYFGKAINAINFVKMHIKINGELVDLAKDQFTDFVIDLDMKRSLLKRSYIIEKSNARIKIEFERFLSADTQELADMYVRFVNLGDAEVDIQVDSVLDGNVYNEDANYDEHFWEVIEQNQADNANYLVMKTTENPFGVPRFTVGGQMINITDMDKQASDNHEDEVWETFTKSLASGQETSLEKRVIIVTSRDYDNDIEMQKAMNELANQVQTESRSELLAKHEAIWNKRWEMSDIEINGSTEAQQGIRFNLYQLFSTYYGEDARLNIGPKGFTGEKYGGATYWDTEAFCLPVYLGSADESVSRNLLQYRYQQLPGAFHNAEMQGLDGALYPMVTFDGIECHNEWEITFEEIHRNGDIAYAIYNYTNYTGDTSYVYNEGAEVLVAISRFFADRVHYSSLKGQYMMHGVTGADEYQNNVDNNWYTNKIGQWTLKYTLEILPNVSTEVLNKLNVTDAEKAKWQDIVEKMYEPYDEQFDIFVQHDGFLDKEITFDENNLPVNTLTSEDLPINQNWSWDKILRSPYIKQADVLQYMWYFMDDYTTDEKKHNFDFYEPLTVHESSLSASIYSIIAADLRYEDKAVELYQRTARLDLDNYNNDTEDGLHITSMAGSWLAIVQGFAGMRVNDGVLSYKPFLPNSWTSYKFRQFFRGRIVELEVTSNQVKVRLISGEPMQMNINGQLIKLDQEEVVL